MRDRYLAVTGGWCGVIRLAKAIVSAIAIAIPGWGAGCGRDGAAGVLPDVVGRPGIGGSDGGTPASGADAATSIPNGAAGGACRTSAQCAGTTPGCDEVTGRCAPCTADTVCPGGNVCDPAGGACVECVTNDDCSAPTATCDPTRHQCVITCRTSAQCGRDVCDTTTGSCLACVLDTDCARGTHCDRARGECVDCLADADCPADAPVCTPGHSCSDACATDADCNDGQGPQDPPSFCDPKNHLCADCLRNADCGADGLCRADGTCG